MPAVNFMAQSGTSNTSLFSAIVIASSKWLVIASWITFAQTRILQKKEREEMTARRDCGEEWPCICEVWNEPGISPEPMRDVSSFPSSPPRAEHPPSRLPSLNAKVRRTGCNAVFINILGVSVSVRFVNETERTNEPPRKDITRRIRERWMRFACEESAIAVKGRGWAISTSAVKERGRRQSRRKIFKTPGIPRDLERQVEKRPVPSSSPRIRRTKERRYS